MYNKNRGDKMPILDAILWSNNKDVRHYVTTRSTAFGKLPFGVHSANIGFLKDNSYVNRSLEQYMLIYTTKGCGVVEYNNKRYILDERKICIIKRNDIVKYYPYNGSVWHLKWIFIEGDACEHYYDICYSDGFDLTEIKSPEIVHGIIEGMKKNIKSPSILSDLACSALMQQLWNIIIEQRQDQALNRKDGVRHMQKCIEYMTGNLDQKITVDELARITNLSKAQFSRVFKKYTGFSPYNYLVHLRINQSKKLLIETDLPLENISQLTGFDGASHLIKYFKLHEGISPNKFKQQHGMM